MRLNFCLHHEQIAASLGRKIARQADAPRSHSRIICLFLSFFYAHPFAVYICRARRETGANMMHFTTALNCEKSGVARGEKRCRSGVLNF